MTRSSRFPSPMLAAALLSAIALLAPFTPASLAPALAQAPAAGPAHVGGAAHSHDASPLPGAATITPIESGAVIETASCRLRIERGVIVSLFNKLTQEEYISRHQKLDDFLARLPSGLGTQAGEANFASAAKVYRWPWNELPEDASLVCYRRPTAKSAFKFAPGEGAAATLTWTGLSDGAASFDDEAFELVVSVDAPTGDVLITPGGRSPRPGVFAANLTLAPTAPLVSIEAPIFDGMRITSDMKAKTWLNKWPEYWDYGFIALNGAETGAVGLWAQDEQMRYKDLFYRVRNRGIAVSLSTMNTPPFDKLKEVKGVTWRLQAFDKSWAQAAARFRDWRLKNVKFAPRADWTRQVSFVNSGVNASKGWLDAMSAYLDGKGLERTVTFGPVIRAAAFDTKHWDNSYYPKFPEEIKAWKPSGAKLMAYLQPMIMWSRPDDSDTEAKKIVTLSADANTKSVFQKELKPLLYVDQHHLGHKEWQAWFLACVKNFIDAGADGVYHDQSYPCPVDARGLVNGMTSPQGMADYFFKAQSQSPGTIHGSEHLQEANTVGASLGIGSGVLWGTAGGMRGQRIRHGSPVSNALHYPNATLWAFPHYSDYGTRGEAEFFHWGLDQMERRGDLAGLALQNTGFYSGKSVPFDAWVNEFKLDRLRSHLFAHTGLRPVYPENWDRSVRTYFRGAGGESFRYEDTPWGSQFVQTLEGGKTKFHYGRAHGSTAAPAPGGIAGWVFYNPQGPSGLHPDRYYVIDPDIKPPAAHFAPAWTIVPETPIVDSFYEGFVDDGCSAPGFAWMRVKPLPSEGNIIASDRIFLKSPNAPVAVFVAGQSAKPEPQGPGTWQLNIRLEQPANLCDVVAILAEPEPGFAGLRAGALLRHLSSYNTDVFSSAYLTTQIKEGKAKLPGTTTEVPTLQVPGGVVNAVHAVQLHLPFKAPANGTLKLHALGNPAGILGVAVNGVAIDKLAPLTFKANDIKLITLTLARQTPQVGVEWIEPEAPKPAAAPAAPAPAAPPASAPAPKK